MRRVPFDGRVNNIIVSGILGVSRLSEHEPGSKDPKNKQCTGGGVSVGSLMLNLG